MTSVEKPPWILAAASSLLSNVAVCTSRSGYFALNGSMIFGSIVSS